MNQQRRDGGIFNCFIDDENKLNTGQDTFLNCINQLNKYSKLENYNPLSIPILEVLNYYQIQKFKDLMAIDKAISYDCISHQFITNCRWEILKDVWKPETFKINKKLGWARLLPPNKVYPKISKKEQFRLLVILSPLFKFLELRFHEKLQEYLKMEYQNLRLDSLMDQEPNLIFTYYQIESKRQKENFIKFQSSLISQALTILLTEICLIPRILAQQDDFRQSIKLKRKILLFEWSTLGIPYLTCIFNIYLDEFLRELIQENMGIQFFGNADDLVLETNLKQMKRLIKSVIKQAKKWNLILNKKKLEQQSSFKQNKSKTKLFQLKSNDYISKNELYLAFRTISDIHRTPLFILCHSSLLQQQITQQINNQYKKKIFKQLTRLLKSTSDEFVNIFCKNYHHIILQQIKSTMDQLQTRKLIEPEQENCIYQQNTKLLDNEKITLLKSPMKSREYQLIIQI
ncbi:unnamed protein product [Paramecium primaurelia]|uniref:Uncharacterized protein n=1 Tax=Paramecium primaurelia TaxID=5886 RepID=A0A8S1NAK7_PARPR|nr:unnamed protein product [Paramecium primaurelia]